MTVQFDTNLSTAHESRVVKNSVIKVLWIFGGGSSDILQSCRENDQLAVGFLGANVCCIMILMAIGLSHALVLACDSGWAALPALGVAAALTLAEVNMLRSFFQLAGSKQLEACGLVLPVEADDMAESGASDRQLARRRTLQAVGQQGMIAALLVLGLAQPKLLQEVDHSNFAANEGVRVAVRTEVAEQLGGMDRDIADATARRADLARQLQEQGVITKTRAATVDALRAELLSSQRHQRDLSEKMGGEARGDPIEGLSQRPGRGRAWSAFSDQLGREQNRAASILAEIGSAEEAYRETQVSLTALNVQLSAADQALTAMSAQRRELAASLDARIVNAVAANGSRAATGLFALLDAVPAVLRRSPWLLIAYLLVAAWTLSIELAPLLSIFSTPLAPGYSRALALHQLSDGMDDVLHLVKRRAHSELELFRSLNNTNKKESADE